MWWVCVCVCMPNMNACICMSANMNKSVLNDKKKTCIVQFEQI